MLLDFY